MYSKANLKQKLSSSKISNFDQTEFYNTFATNILDINLVNNDFRENPFCKKGKFRIKWLNDMTKYHKLLTKYFILKKNKKEKKNVLIEEKKGRVLIEVY